MFWLALEALAPKEHMITIKKLYAQRPKQKVEHKIMGIRQLGK